jgi:Arc/MetJ family transcription regulator
MRTTLTIDDDIAAEIEALRQARRVSLRSVVNDALRRGLIEMGKARKQTRKAFETKSFDLGEARLPIDNVAEALALAEGEGFS